MLAAVMEYAAKWGASLLPRALHRTLMEDFPTRKQRRTADEKAELDGKARYPVCSPGVIK